MHHELPQNTMHRLARCQPITPTLGRLPAAPSYSSTATATAAAPNRGTCATCGSMRFLPSPAHAGCGPHRYMGLSQGSAQGAGAARRRRRGRRTGRERRRGRAGARRASRLLLNLLAQAADRGAHGHGSRGAAGGEVRRTGQVGAVSVGPLSNGSFTPPPTAPACDGAQPGCRAAGRLPARPCSNRRERQERTALDRLPARRGPHLST